MQKLTNTFSALDQVTGVESAANYAIRLVSGGVQLGIIPTETGVYQFVVVSDEESGAYRLIDEDYSTMKKAIERLHRFLLDEYEQADT